MFCLFLWVAVPGVSPRGFTVQKCCSTKEQATVIEAPDQEVLQHRTGNGDSIARAVTTVPSVSSVRGTFRVDSFSDLQTR
jgi:hypothetical protein